MKRQLIYLPDYKWHIEVFYDVTKDGIPEVMDALAEIGCPADSLERSYNNIISGRANGGLTYTNVRLRESLMSIGFSSTLPQFLNTAAHECFHAVMHICNFYKIDPMSEECAYLCGDIMEQMHPLLEEYMCECKKCKH